MDFTDSEAGDKVLEIQNELSRWLSQLPARLQLGNLHPEQKSFRGAVHLHMNSNQITIYMGRTALLRRIQRYLHHLRDDGSSEDGKSRNPPESDETGSRDDSDLRLSRDCVAAAYRIVDLIRHLYDVGKLARFSFTDMNCCSTAAIIVMIHEIMHRHPLFNTSMSAILQAMRFMASGCQNARHALTMAQDLLAMTTTIKNKYPEPPTDGGDREPAGEEEGRHRSGPVEGYEQWETWMAEAENWAVGSSRQSDASRLAMSCGADANWEMDTSGGYALAQPELVGFTPLVENGFGQAGMQTGLTYSWPDDLNSLGLSGFGGFDFLNI